MPWEAWLTVGVIVAILVILVTTRAAPDMTFLGGLVVLLAAGVVPAREAFAGLANPGVITVAALYVVVAGLKETGAVQWLVQSVLGRPRSLGHAQVKLTLPVAAMSGFLNNTPVVAMLIPAVSEWARKFQLPVSKLMMPLSYAAILGGTCTLIGTSTNLVVDGLLIDFTGTGLHLFDLAWVGVPMALIGLGFLFATARWLLPDRSPAMAELTDPREYTIEMLVEEGSPLAGRTIEEAGLRNIPGGYLMEIDRDGHVLPAVGRHEVLQQGDRLVFVGVVESMVDLQKIRGLTPATDQVFKLDGSRAERPLVEAVVSDTCPVVGKTVRDGRFRTRYNAVVIAVARNGERLKGKIGDIVLQAGDTLLLEARPSFLEQQRNSRDFLLVSRLGEQAAPRHEKALLAVGILAAMVLAVALTPLPMVIGALVAAGAMVVSGCLPVDGARRSLDWSVLLVIAAAFGIGRALEGTGAAEALAWQLLALAGDQPWVNLAVIYVATALFTAVITNNAAAVLMVPIAFAVAGDLGASVVPFAVAIMLAASASFATPIGYQTNLMVLGPGGYRFGDYLRAGLPLNVVTALVAIGLIPLIWGF